MALFDKETKVHMITISVTMVILIIILLTFFLLPKNSSLSTPLIELKGWVYSIANYPTKAANTLIKNFEQKQALLKENELLKIDVAILQNKVNQLQSLQIENTQLKRLLKAIDINKNNVQVANIVREIESYNGHRVYLNKGTSNGVFIGQPIIDNYGLYGQVIQASANFSLVMLISDADSVVPVFNQRTGFRTLALGQNDFESLRLQQVNQGSDIQIGDIFLTSGIGEIYPRGLKVGEVSEINQMSRGSIAQVILTTSATLRRSNPVLLWFNE